MNKKMMLVLLAFISAVGIVSAKDKEPKKKRTYSADEIKKKQSKDAKASLKEAKKKAKNASGKAKNVKTKKNKAEKKALLQESGKEYTEAAVGSTLAMEQAMSEMAKAKNPAEVKAAQAVAKDAAKTSEILSNAERDVNVAEDKIDESASDAEITQAENKVGATTSEVERIRE